MTAPHAFTLEQVRQIFTDWAPRYDASHGSPLLKRHEARLALGVQPGDRVLEVACGTGLNFPHLRQLVGEEGQLVGVELVPAMLEIAQKRMHRHGWTNVSLVAGDAARLPFVDGAFDRAFCAFALNIIPEYREAVTEVKRVLLPGGRFVALEMSMNVDSVPRCLGPIAHRLMGVCAVDLSHRSLEAIRQVFGEVQLRRHWMGMIYIAAADKKRRQEAA
jgi:ubiquinone/menaquinone biosynthesis C-methylase UbiE